VTGSFRGQHRLNAPVIGRFTKLVCRKLRGGCQVAHRNFRRSRLHSSFSRFYEGRDTIAYIILSRKRHSRRINVSRIRASSAVTWRVSYKPKTKLLSQIGRKVLLRLCSKYVYTHIICIYIYNKILRNLGEGIRALVRVLKYARMEQILA